MTCHHNPLINGSECKSFSVHSSLAYFFKCLFQRIQGSSQFLRTIVKALRTLLLRLPSLRTIRPFSQSSLHKI